MKRYKKILSDPGQRDLIDEFNAKSNGLPVKIYKHRNFKIETISLRDYEERSEEIKQIYVNTFDHIFRTTNPQKENAFQTDLISRMEKDSLYSVDYIPSRGKYSDSEVTTYYFNREIFAWLKESAILQDNQIFKANKVTTIWPHGDIPKADLSNEGGVDFKRGKKPEQLIKRVLEISTKPNDWILDSFAGSGTTGAVAHKMGRKWIMCELGEHCDTHCLPRLKRVVSGEDQTGISKEVSWQGGGGFKYYRLAESLLVRDKDLSTNRHPVYIINPRYDEKILIRAICKIENFRYRNEGRLHGVSSESRFLHVTTNLLTQPYLYSLAEDIGKDQSLLIYCTRRRRGLVVPDNIEIKKIPRDLLVKCDFEEDKK
jgi:adenine-specific DNA-methyltransferase